MTTDVPNPRYERKFVARTETLTEVLAAVHRHPAAFREVYPPRAVNNIYLDSPSLRDYTDHLHGATRRVKTRLRWYGDLLGQVDAPALERKIKAGGISGKVVYALPSCLVDAGVGCANLESVFDRAGMPEVLRLALRHMGPVLANRYDRRYFLSGDGRFRLTVDSTLQFFGLHRMADAATSCTSRASGVIIELKFHPSEADRAATVTGVLPFRLTRCSKYVLGIEHVRRR